MKTNEETIFENENTIFEEKVTPAAAAPKSAAEAVKKETDNTARIVSIAGVSGLMLGGAISAFAFNNNPDDLAETGEEIEEEMVAEDRPEWADDSVAIAETVSDDMSFSQAFAAARAEVGPGGAFEWRGHVYGTYTAAEWNSMSAAERAEYNDHFSWNHYHGSSSASASETAPVPETPQQPEENLHSGENQHGEENPHGGEDVNAVSDGPEGPADPDDGINIVSTNPTDVNAGDILGTDDGVEVEILGVVYDEETGTNIGGMTVDGQEVFLIDVDDSGTFNYMLSDLDGDGEISDGEVLDISDANISVDHFDDSFSGNDFYAPEGGEIDYINGDAAI